MLNIESAFPLDSPDCMVAISAVSKYSGNLSKEFEKLFPWFICPLSVLVMSLTAKLSVFSDMICKLSAIPTHHLRRCPSSLKSKIVLGP